MDLGKVLEAYNTEFANRLDIGGLAKKGINDSS